MTETKKKKGKQTGSFSDSKGAGSKGERGNSLELLVITRETYRAPVDSSQPVQVQIRKDRFDAVNVARRGIGFIVPGPDAFQLEEILDPVTVICGKTRIPLKGRVVHISPSETGRYLCGIEFIYADEKAQLQFEAYLERNRLALFSRKEQEPQQRRNKLQPPRK